MRKGGGEEARSVRFFWALSPARYLGQSVPSQFLTVRAVHEVDDEEITGRACAQKRALLYPERASGRRVSPIQGVEGLFRCRFLFRQDVLSGVRRLTIETDETSSYSSMSS